MHRAWYTGRPCLTILLLLAHQFAFDKGQKGAASTDWAEWSVWSGANGGEYYNGAERERERREAIRSKL